jgi:Leucine-rich repeat (LRR) protein/uridine kinase
MGQRIRKIGARLNKIVKDGKNFNFTPRLIETQLEHRRREDTHSFVPDEEVIGREEEKKDVKALLFNSDVIENVSIIPIVGIGGQGKTTLAQYVYNDEEVQRHFDLRMWTCVSDPFDVKTIVQKLIESATKKRPVSLEIDLLLHLLRETIDGKRYLLVLDDVWNENSNKWFDLKNLLVGGQKGSKVLVTTRNEKVANITCTASPYFLGGLSESNSWDLFKKMAFKDGEEPKNLKLVEIGREIVQKCARNPLAIRSIGSLLYLKNSEDEWLKFQTIGAKLNKIAKDGKNFNFTPRLIETQLEHRRREDTHSFVPDEKVIGREEEKKDVKALLFDSNVKENVSIIPIVGIGGQGKTTLAQYVYNDKEVQRYFDLRMWTCVSDPFDVKTIVQKLIESATKKRPKSLEIDVLQSLFRETINGKRYLLVLDDVWNENSNKWFDLKNLLVGGHRGSKVLVTTRNEKVANITCTTSTYFLGGLSESNSWNLFEKMAFKNEEEPNIKLVEIGREIVQKCARNPLAIRSTGSLLYLKNSEDDWLAFQTNKLYEINKQGDDIFPILKRSYDHLPPHLKQCFEICSLFPKDFTIRVEVLIQLWTSQGFIHSSDKTNCLEDVGREYFMDLLWRSFFQDMQRNEHGDIESCKMHDLIHDLAQSIAGDEYLILNLDATKVVERARHVAFDSLNSLRDFPASLLKVDKVRTLLQLPRSEFSLPKLDLNRQVYDTLISSFKCLRSLNLSRSNIQEVPNSIDKLKHLRYLNLSWNVDIKLLPASITKLQNLQTLILDVCSELKELPKDTRNLISLRHLALYRCESLTHMPHGLGKLTALQTLSFYILGKKESYVPKKKGGLSDLSGLDELSGRLHIRGLEHLRSSPLEARAADLERKQYLRTLKLDWGRYIEAGYDKGKAIANDEQLLQNLRPHLNLKELIIEGYAGEKFSGWVSLLSNLVSITISYCECCNHIPPLGQFPSLKYLSLNFLSAMEYISKDASDVSSSSLQSLSLTGLFKLRGWWREAVTTEHEQNYNLPLFPSFPSLSSLCIKGCPIRSIMGDVALGSQTTPSSSSPFSTLSKLKHLSLYFLEELEYMPVEWLQNLTSLEILNIWECPKLQISISPLFEHLAALEDMRISNCKKLISNEDEEGVQYLGRTTLRRLDIRNVKSLVSLPRELRHATALKWLEIENCPSLESLPEWIADLTSLQTLKIYCCRRLEERCKERKGKDWLKIAHIPNFSIDWASCSTNYSSGI